MPLEEQWKAGRVIWIEADVFIHVKNVDLRPRHMPVCPQRGKKRQLRVTCRDDDVGNALLLDRAPDDGKSLLSRRLAQFLIRPVDADQQILNSCFVAQV